MEMPIIPLTDPKNQFETILDFCAAWGGPIEITYNDQRLVMTPYDYDLKNLCTPEEAERLNVEISEKASNTD